MRITPATELTDRFQRLQSLMLQESLDAVILAQNADLFYFSGATQQGLLYIPVDGEPLYLVRRDFGRARMESGLKHLVPLRSPRDLPGVLADFGYATPKRVGLELDVLPVAFFRRLEKVLTGCDFRDATPLIRGVRAVKSDYEISIMKDAALIADKIHQRAAEVIREGITDLELAAELEFHARKEGHQGYIRMRGFNSEIFFGHAFSGPDSAVPTGSDTPLGGMGLNPSFAQGASYKKIRPQEPVLVDFVSCFDGYMVDQTRLFCIGGLDPKLEKGFADMLQIQQLLMEQARPGVAWGAIYDTCLQAARQLGYGEHFMGAGNARVSFIGHGVGVELDEYPFIARGFNDQLLEEKMTFAFEPKVVFPGLGAVGIENTFWVSGDGLKSLTYSDQSLRIL
ncbi:M24 family metallopeptidase [Geothermobacter hydrogeniphilus]|uniref:Peptidase M24 n=1 Tax=Geothermobacter hydrogeniphilus TaxID=1969733 RepID=A0A1X0XXH6_9BACT|nr:Xaa-Pro peptidase family protein [Geothermobacter hydrogeniphilus]ORJ57552.1 peptidase M24 [Geothermobacter hydrogeniphilus]